MPQYDAFLSYARKDEAHADGTPADYTDPDDSFVKRLYDALTAAELKIWWDRAEMPARGKPFLDEVRDAILDSERFLLVGGPKAFASAYVRDEIAYALNHCRVMNPIIRKGDYPDFPPELNNGDVPDFRDDKLFESSLEQLIRQLKMPIAPTGTLHGVPPLPPYYIERKEVFAELGQKVGLSVEQVEAGKPLVITAASKPGVLLQGMGGLGKSTLATALAHDCNIQRQFPDGIVWLTVGRSPQITAVQESLGLTFGDRRENYTLQPEDNKRALAYLLREKRALIILDDLWEKAHADALVIHAPLCRFLLTTRQSKLVTQMGLTAAQEVKLDTLTAAEAIRLIETRLGKAAPDQHTAFERIHELLEGHTLALTLAAGRIAEKGAAYAPEYVTALERRLSSDNPFFGLDELETDDKSVSVAVTLAESYDALSGAMQRRFRLLGIFAPDGTFDAKAAAAVWAEPVEDAPEYLRVLVGASLLSDAGNERYDHHALLRAHARARMSGEEKRETFDRYADYVIAFSEQFATLPPEQWSMLEPDLPHVHEVGDALVRLTTKNDDELQRDLAFAVKARYYLVRRRQVRRLEWLEMGLKTVRQLVDKHPDEIDNYRQAESRFLNDLGLAWSALGEKRQALEYYEQALLLQHAVGDRGSKATLLNNIGGAWSKLGEKRKALEYYEQALLLQRAVGDRGGEAAVLHNLGSAWYDVGEKRKALEYYEQALPLVGAIGDRGAEATTLSSIGLVWSDLGEKPKALEYYEQALPVQRAVGDRGGEADTLNYIGRLWQQLGEPQKALKYYEQALLLHQDVEDRGGEATTLNNIGLVWSYIGEPQRALEFFGKALPLFRAVGDRGSEAATLTNIGEGWRQLREPHKALEYYEQALLLHHDVGDRSGEAVTLSNMGSTCLTLGEKRKALDLFEQALPLLHAVGDPLYIALALNNIAGIYFQNGELKRSAGSFRQIITIVETMGAVAEEALFRINFAVTLGQMGNIQEAVAQAEQALALLRSRNLPQDAGGTTVEQMETILAQLRGQSQPRGGGWLQRLFGKRG